VACWEAKHPAVFGGSRKTGTKSVNKRATSTISTLTGPGDFSGHSKQMRHAGRNLTPIARINSVRHRAADADGPSPSFDRARGSR
jgi:hypothetical protein